MPEPMNGHAALEALFARGGTAPARDPQFVQQVMQGIRRQERMRRGVLAASGLAAVAVAAPSLWIVLAVWDTSAVSALIQWMNWGAFPSQFTEIIASAARAAGEASFAASLAALLLAGVAAVLFRWTAD